MAFTIRFDFPTSFGGVVYAGDYKGALGYAPTLDTAFHWPTREIAERFLDGYLSMASYGTVIEVPA